jgi:KaiC/GvpD/RAD55 family RecA-like ATPase
MSRERRIPTGIAGLDRVIEGGVRDNTTLLVVGSSGTGKSTFAMQYLNYGLEHGENGLYISMEEPPEQILREAKMLGFNLDKYYEKELFFFHSKGKDFVKLVDEQLPALVEMNKNFSVKTRVVIDPLTPLTWAIHDKQEQR